MDIPASMQLNAPMLVTDTAASAPSPLPLYGSNPASQPHPHSHQHQHFVRYRHSCEHCRKRKIKCSGTRPICDHCLRRSIPCIYKPLARTRRTPSLANSPATHGYSQPHASGDLFYDGPQPIPIPAAGAHPGLSPGYPTTPNSISPAALRYSSAPAASAMNPAGFAHMFGDNAAAAGQQQGKMLRPANAIPPYLLAPSAPLGQSPDCSPFAFAPASFSAFPSPADYAGGQQQPPQQQQQPPQQPGSFNSMHSDLSDILGQPPQQPAAASLYDLQAARQQPEPGGLGAYVSPKAASFFNQDGSLSLLPFPPPPASDQQGMLWQEGGGGGGRHRRTLTGGSADSLSNVPLAERASNEEGGDQGQWMLAQLGFAQQQQLLPQAQQQTQQQQQLPAQDIMPRAAGGIAPGLTVLDQPPAESQASAPPTG
ncbi:hypothetical protein LPJ53_002441 [Coemansia erecta]|uniref:Zn(2)-C6 fungal-type domain-containing protein n=1 Tax=Coemansia erecta TaxID=147472 RepID=A0A9W7Y3D3_9FUNG|nr:hypothetical protein LPJ53_002441 [Coemansia erecta]